MLDTTWCNAVAVHNAELDTTLVPRYVQSIYKTNAKFVMVDKA